MMITYLLWFSLMTVFNFLYYKIYYNTLLKQYSNLREHWNVFSILYSNLFFFFQLHSFISNLIPNLQKLLGDKKKSNKKGQKYKTRRNSWPIYIKLGGGNSFSSSYLSFYLYNPYNFCNFKFDSKVHFFYNLVPVNKREERKLLSSDWRERKFQL